MQPGPGPAGGGWELGASGVEIGAQIARSGAGSPRSGSGCCGQSRERRRSGTVSA